MNTKYEIKYNIQIQYSVELLVLLHSNKHYNRTRGKATQYEYVMSEKTSCQDYLPLPILTVRTRNLAN
jgi:hypothetical protein